MGGNEKKVTGDWVKLYIAESHDSFSSPNTLITTTAAIKSSMVGSAYMENNIKQALKKQVCEMD